MSHADFLYKHLIRGIAEQKTKPMKKVLILSSLLLLGITSCKKDRICRCTTSGTFQTSSGTTTTNGTSTTTIKNVDTQHGNLLCSSGNSTTTQSGANGYTTTDRTDCTLQ